MWLLHNTLVFSISTESKEPEKADVTISDEDCFPGIFFNSILTAGVVRSIPIIFATGNRYPFSFKQQLNNHHRYLPSTAITSASTIVPVLSFPSTVEQESVASGDCVQPPLHEHSYWSGASWLRQLQPIQEHLVSLDIFTMFSSPL